MFSYKPMTFFTGLRLTIHYIFNASKNIHPVYLRLFVQYFLRRWLVQLLRAPVLLPYFS